MSLHKLQETVKDRGAWHAAVHGVAKSWTWLSKQQQRVIKIIETESRMVLARVIRDGGSQYLMHTGFHFWKMKKILEQMVVMVVQQCECMQYHWTVHLKMVTMLSFMLCIFYQNKNENECSSICILRLGATSLTSAILEEVLLKGTLLKFIFVFVSEELYI